MSTFQTNSLNGGQIVMTVLHLRKFFTVHEQNASNLWSQQSASQQAICWEPFTVDMVGKTWHHGIQNHLANHIMVRGRCELDIRDTLHLGILKQEVAMMGEVLAVGISSSKVPVYTSYEPSQLQAKWDICVPADHEALIQVLLEVQEGQAWKSPCAEEMGQLCKRDKHRTLLP